MDPVPDELRGVIARWADLARAERIATARQLRAAGLSLGEIEHLLPVSKSTVSVWCRGIVLTGAQRAGIQQRRGPQKGVPRDTQWRRRVEVAAIRQEAEAAAPGLMAIPEFVGGLALYWAEGSKAAKELAVANTDPRLLNVFVAWVREFLDPDADFVLALHLHEGNDPAVAKQYWSGELLLDRARYTKSHLKPRGTGHRKNHLPHGVCRVRVCRSGDSWHRVMAWIDAYAEESKRRALASLPGGSLAQLGRATDS